MEWTAALLCREMLAINPFKLKLSGKQYREQKCGKQLFITLNKLKKTSFKVSVRSIRDRYSLLAKKFRKRMTSEQKASGISPEMSELDVLKEELTGLEDI